jgi:hypothetical protein
MDGIEMTLERGVEMEGRSVESRIASRKMFEEKILLGTVIFLRHCGENLNGLDHFIRQTPSRVCETVWIRAFCSVNSTNLENSMLISMAWTQSNPC